MRDICQYVQISRPRPRDVYSNKKISFILTFDFKNYPLLSLKNTDEKYY